MWKASSTSWRIVRHLGELKPKPPILLFWFLLVQLHEDEWCSRTRSRGTADSIFLDHWPCWVRLMGAAVQQHPKAQEATFLLKLHRSGSGQRLPACLGHHLSTLCMLPWVPWWKSEYKTSKQINKTADKTSIKSNAYLQAYASSFFCFIKDCF